MSEPEAAVLLAEARRVALAALKLAEPSIRMNAQAVLRDLAERCGAEVLTGTSGMNQCPPGCTWAGPGNQVVGGVHRHPFAAVMDELEYGR